MKRLQFLTGLAMLVLCSGAQAQSVVMLANIPFEFQMGSKQMPAGDYVIHYAPHLVTLQQGHGGTAATALTTSTSRAKAPETGILQFNRYGDAYFLSNIWTPYSGDGASFFKSPREKELARQISHGQPTEILASTR